MNYYSDEKEWLWMFRNAIDWNQILPLYYPTYPTEDGLNNKEEVISFLEELMANTGEWCGTAVADRAAELDKIGAGEVKDGRTYLSAPMQQLVKEATELSVFGLPLPRKYGGLETPVSIYFLFLNQLSRGCMSSTTLIAFFTSIAEMINRYCDDETGERLIPKIIAGEISGSMNLTEPGCGSDLSMIRTSAAPQADGSYLLNGSKIFITNGGGGIGFILAKVKGAPDDLSGISMFFAEQDITLPNGEKHLNWKVMKNEHKMGMHGSFTTEILYENTKAYLVGKEGEGFKYMLHLMNEARICVGIQALGGIESCLYHAKKYAEERVQFGLKLTELPLFKRNLQDYETERDALRALLVDTMSHFDVYLKLESKEWHTKDLSKEEKAQLKEASLWTRKRTPLVKYYACETYTHLSQRAIQMLGGYGFMEEYPLERIHRDSFGPLLYEGTSQIQALMALKDIIKYAISKPKGFFSSIFYKHPSTAFLNGEKEWSRKYKSSHYQFKKKMLGLLFATLKPEASQMLDFKNWQNPENINSLMEHAETLCQALCYMETLRVLCSHADKDAARADLFHRYHTLVTPRLEAIYTDWSLRV